MHLLGHVVFSNDLWFITKIKETFSKRLPDATGMDTTESLADIGASCNLVHHFNRFLVPEILIFVFAVITLLALKYIWLIYIRLWNNRIERRLSSLCGCIIFNIHISLNIIKYSLNKVGKCSRILAKPLYLGWVLEWWHLGFEVALCK